MGVALVGESCWIWLYLVHIGGSVVQLRVVAGALMYSSVNEYETRGWRVGVTSYIQCTLCLGDYSLNTPVLYCAQIAADLFGGNF